MARNTTTRLRSTIAAALAVVCATTVLTATPGTAQTVTDGSIDSTFTVTTDGYIDEVNAIAVMGSGRIVIGGPFGVERLNTDGTDDSSFTRIEFYEPYRDAASLFPPAVQSVLRRGTKILVGGENLCLDDFGSNCRGIFRFDESGRIDNTFRSDSWYSDGDVFSIGWRSAAAGSGEDNIITGGRKTGFGSSLESSLPAVACIRSGGAECLAFDSPRDFEGFGGTRIDVVAVMASGRIVVGGDFDGGIKRLEINGRVDTTFSPPDALGTGMVTSIVQTGSKILVGGSFRGRIKRLTESGSEDTSFTPPTLNGDVHAIAVQGDGKILVGGSFAGKVKRLNSDVSTDGNFVPPTLDNSVRTIALQDDGKILIGGDFDGAIKRLNNPSQSSSDSRSGTILGGGGDSSNAVWIIVIAASGLAVVGGGVAAGVGIARRRKPANS